MSQTLTGSASVDELVEATRPGWPRMRFRRPGEKAHPMPWINALNPAMKPRGWIEMHGQRVRQAEEQRLCFCCGQELAELSVMGRHRASFLDTDTGQWIWMTDGPPGHPRCVALAAAHCPHLLDQHEGHADYTIALLWRGATTGYVETPQEMSIGEPRYVVRPGAVALSLGELRKLAARDPLGVG